MAGWFRNDRRPHRGGYVAIREYTYSSLPKPLPKWSRPAKLAFLASVSLAFVYFLVSGELGILRLHSLRQYHEDLKAQEMALTAQVVDLDTRHRLLETDTLFIEGIARSELQFSRPGETVYELTPKPATTNPTDDRSRKPAR